MNTVAFFEMDLVEVKEIDGYTVKIYDDDWYDRIVIEKDGNVLSEKTGYFTEADIDAMVNNLK